MDITAELSEAVTLCGDPVGLPDKVFSLIVDRALTDILTTYPRGAEVATDFYGALNAADGKLFYNSLLGLSIEAAKSGADKGTISAKLEECQWGPDRIALYIDRFEEHRHQLAQELDRIGTSYPNVVDIRWRLDYYIKDNFVEKINKATYLISLRTQQPGQSSLDAVEFACSEEQLQDLVSKLKDATKTLEKAAQL